MNGENKYDDIINLPHHTSENRTHMPLCDRAAQFSPFTALTGHEDALRETARLTDMKAELDESEKKIIDEKLRQIINCAEKPPVTVTYFMPDGRKNGCAYVKAEGYIKKTDLFRREIVMSAGEIIPVENIFEIDFLEKFAADEELYL